MWQCARCGREFAKIDQGHFCGASASIDEYISEQDESLRPLLEQIRACIREAAPDSIERISWRMPTFWQERRKGERQVTRQDAEQGIGQDTKRDDRRLAAELVARAEAKPVAASTAKPAAKKGTRQRGENLVHFAAFKKHIGLYPGAEAVEVFAKRLARYKTGKGTIQLPLDKPLDFDLIADITRWRLRRVQGVQGMLAGEKTYEFSAVIQPADGNGAYVAFPYDLQEEFGKGRLKVHATFDGKAYDGSIVNMGVKNADGSICYIVGVRKDIRAKIAKQIGDTVQVTIRERK